MRNFHGEGKRHSYFEGWYLKQQNNTETVALIPAYHIDGTGRPSASLQIVGGTETCWLSFPAREFHADRKEFLVRIGNCVFSRRGCKLSVHADGCTLEGALSFGAFTQPSGDIMGPFRFAPFLQCRHSVFSLYHRVNGTLTLNGRKILFRNGSGYFEGDRGMSFPKRYVWTQCSHRGNSVMLSVADVPFCGKSFTGCIGSLFLNGTEHRIATYLGAKPLKIGDNGVLLRQGNLTLQISLLESHPLRLHAPAGGDMSRMIRESASCRVRYRCMVGKRIWFDFTSEQASFESNWGNSAETGPGPASCPPPVNYKNS